MDVKLYLDSRLTIDDEGNEGYTLIIRSRMEPYPIMKPYPVALLRIEDGWKEAFPKRVTEIVKKCSAFKPGRDKVLLETLEGIMAAAVQHWNGEHIHCTAVLKLKQENEKAEVELSKLYWNTRGTKDA